MKLTAIERKDLVPRFWFCLVFTLPFFLRTLDPWIAVMLGTIVVAVGAFSFFHHGCTLKFNRFTLYFLCVALLYFYSLLEFLFSATPKLLFDQAAAVTTCLNLGLLLEKELYEQAQSPIQNLLTRRPKKALKIFQDGHVEEVSIEKITKDDAIRISGNELIPVDGVIFSGYGIVDESLISGESTPVEKVFGQKVFAGTQNLKESFIVRAVNIGKHTLLEKIIKKVTKTLAEKPQRQPLLIPSVIGLSIFTLLAVSLFSGLTAGILSSAALLIIANPRAITLAKELPKNSTISLAALQGIVISSRKTLEKIDDITMIVFGKRDILTAGTPSIIALEMTQGTSEKELLATAASLEATSSHPIAEQIIDKAKLSGVEREPALEPEHILGLGIKGLVNGNPALVGDEKLLEGIDLEELKIQAKELRKKGAVVLFCAKNNHLLGIIAIADPFRHGAKEAIASIKNKGLKLFCLSGDRRITVVQAVNALGFDRFQAEAKPAQKLATLKKLQSEGHIIAFYGDPIKNLDLITKADLGIANGPGNDLDETQAPVVLLSSGLSGVARLFSLSHHAIKIERQNLILAYTYNTIALVVAFVTNVSLITATLVMILSTLVVAFHSLKVLRSNDQETAPENSY